MPSLIGSYVVFSCYPQRVCLFFEGVWKNSRSGKRGGRAEGEKNEVRGEDILSERRINEKSIKKNNEV